MGSMPYQLTGWRERVEDSRRSRRGEKSPRSQVNTRNRHKKLSIERVNIRAQAIGPKMMLFFARMVPILIPCLTHLVSPLNPAPDLGVVFPSSSSLIQPFRSVDRVLQLGAAILNTIN
jgi:hypothetical protein